MLLKQYIYSILYVALGGWISIWLWSLLGALFFQAFIGIAQGLLVEWNDWYILLLFLSLHVFGPIIGGYIFLKISRRNFDRFESPELWWHVIFFSFVTGFIIDGVFFPAGVDFLVIDSVVSGIYTIAGLCIGVILVIVAYATKSKKFSLKNSSTI